MRNGVLYNACKAYAGQIQQGEDYHLTEGCDRHHNLGFIILPELGSLLNKFKLRTEAGEVYSDDLELVFVELLKFMKSESELETLQDR